MVDARAQCTIVADDCFRRHMDKPVAMIAMTNVWAATRKNRDMRNAELKREVPTGWTEGVEGSAWKLQRDEEHDCAGGGCHGPSLAARACCEAQSLADLFMFFFPLPLLQTIEQETNRCGNEDWVRPVARASADDNSVGAEGAEGEDDDDNEQDRSKQMLIACPKSHANARHCFKGAAKKWRNVTPGFILIFFGIICILGATEI
jgi:hypothetical protein